jgi:hypothetical protein
MKKFLQDVFYGTALFSVLVAVAIGLIPDMSEGE